MKFHTPQYPILQYYSNSGDNVSVISGAVLAPYTSSSNLTDQEEEMLRIFRTLDMRQKNTAMTYLYNLEDEAKESHSQLNDDK